MRSPRLPAFLPGSANRARLTDEQQLMLELIADRPMPAIPEFERYTAVLSTTKLIALSKGSEWKITALGEALLERRRHYRTH